LDEGFDYLSAPTLKITGGNGSGCIAYANLIQKDHSLTFDSTSTGGFVNLTNNTIGFSTFHKFRDGELVTYITDTQTAIAGLSTGSPYFCSITDSTTVKLHSNYQDAIAGVDAIDLTAYGVGIQEIKCANTKKSS